MQKCFKLGIDSCPINPSFQRNKIFIDIPFSTEYLERLNSSSNETHEKIAKPTIKDIFLY